MINKKELLRRRAHWISRHTLKSCHDVWASCKVRYSHAHVYTLTFELLHKGYSEQQIQAVYENKLREWHTKASDRGETFEPSGLVSDVRKSIQKLEPNFDPDEYRAEKEAKRIQQEEASKRSFASLCKEYGIKQF
jgi:hypothetical protein